MLAKQFRLTGTSDYKRVQEKGSTFQSKNFGIAIYERQDGLPSRFGVVISNKVAKDAVDRNTVRRHISETIRLMTKDIKKGCDVAFLAKTSIIRVPAEELVKEVRRAVHDSGLMV